MEEITGQTRTNQGLSGTGELYDTWQ